jgi:hypothetical protein
VGLQLGRKGRSLLAVLLGCIALLVLAPAALAGTGSISGTVAGPFNEPLLGARVTYSGPGTSFVETNARGEYEVSALSAGSYYVDFCPPSGMNLAPQVYKEASPPYMETFVHVEEGKKTEGISAVLQQGGAVSGQVTDAGTHEPIPHITVSPANQSFSTPCEHFSSVETNANGEYNVVGLVTGPFNLEFYPSLQFVPYSPPGGEQFYQFAEVPFRVTEGRTTSGINVALERSEPVNISQLGLSGLPAVGQRLVCSNGSWTGRQPIAFSYEWLRDGSAIDGATQTTYIVQPTDQGHELACQVKATNRAGGATARSYALNVPPSPALNVPPSPTIQSVSQSNSRWREGNRLASYSRNRPPVGTTFKFVLSQQAVVSFAFTQQVGGRKVGARCVAQTTVNRHRPGCKHTVNRGTLAFNGHAGLNEVAFQGRISRAKKLPLGAYILGISAVNSAGRTSTPDSLSFTIIK